MCMYDKGMCMCDKWQPAADVVNATNLQQHHAVRSTFVCRISISISISSTFVCHISSMQQQGTAVWRCARNVVVNG